MKRNIKNTINQQVRAARQAYRAEDVANGETFRRDVATGGTVVVNSQLLREKRSWTNKHPQVVDYDAAVEARKAHKSTHAQWAPPSPGDLVMWYRFPWTWNKVTRVSDTNDNEPTVALVVNVVESTTSRPVVTLMVDGQTFRTTIEHVRTMDMFE